MRNKPRLSFPAYFSRHKGHGNGLIIKGGVRKGKSTTCSLITRQLLMETDFNIISNVRFKNEVYDEFPDRLHYITTDLEYFERYIETPDDSPSLLVWDDVQASEGFQSTETFSSPAKKLQSFLIFIGKLETSFIYVAHRSYIPRALTEGFEPLYLHILRRGSFYITPENYESAQEVREAVSRNKGYFVPLPTWDKLESQILPILSRAPAGFEFVLDHNELYRHLRRFDIGEDLKRGIREYLGQATENDEENREIQRLQSMSYESIFLALCLKRGRLISGGEKMKEVINPTVINDARQKARKLGVK